MKSLWVEDINRKAFPALEGDLKTDVLVIGGGIAGILCGFFLQQAGVDYAVVEADTICSGVTANTTAKITSQHGLVYHRLVREFGAEKARLYLEANEWALGKYRELCRTIDCNFEQQDSYVYSVRHPERLERELKALGQIGRQGEYVQKLPLPFPTDGAVCFRDQAQFQPLKFLLTLAQGMRIYEHTRVKELAPCMAVAEKGRIRAGNIVTATHYPIDNKHGAYFMKQYQSRSYVIALENAVQMNGMYVDQADKGLSFRNAGELLLLGGGSHRTGKQGGKWQELREISKRYYPDAVEKYHWATQDCMTLDGVPYIGLYGKHTEGFYVTSGYNKWGMTTAMVSAMLLTDLITGKRNPYEKVFWPHRSILRPQLAGNMLESAKNFLTPSPRRCPHMGCALKWNPQERTWDCPCHGSRFTKEGKLTDNPATDDLNAR